jgi:hypothetical protein
MSLTVSRDREQARPSLLIAALRADRVGSELGRINPDPGVTRIHPDHHVTRRNPARQHSRLLRRPVRLVGGVRDGHRE